MTPRSPVERSCPFLATVPYADGRQLRVVPVAVDRNFGQISTGAAMDFYGAPKEIAFTFMAV